MWSFNKGAWTQIKLWLILWDLSKEVRLPIKGEDLWYWWWITFGCLKYPVCSPLSDRVPWDLGSLSNSRVSHLSGTRDTCTDNSTWMPQDNGPGTMASGKHLKLISPHWIFIFLPWGAHVSWHSWFGCYSALEKGLLSPRKGASHWESHKPCDFVCLLAWLFYKGSHSEAQASNKYTMFPRMLSNLW